MTRLKRKGWADINPPVSRVRSTMYVLFDDRPSVHKNSISAWDGSLSGTAMGVATTKNALRLGHVQRIHSRTAPKKKYYYVRSTQYTTLLISKVMILTAMYTVTAKLWPPL